MTFLDQNCSRVLEVQKVNHYANYPRRSYNIKLEVKYLLIMLEFVSGSSLKLRVKSGCIKQNEDKMVSKKM